ncbi:MAG TPA: SCO family protein [Thermoanaerobaculia bacterium]|nr:SCO family protein [Thermoanaerobaculia bacterium]
MILLLAALLIPDVPVVDQSGQALHFHRDLIAGRVVVVAFFFTSCEEACPIVAHTLVGLQRALGDRRDVSIVSVSLDPEHDTPERLAAWARRFGVRPGWTLVTGPPSSLRRLAKTMTGDDARPGVHEAVLYIGNDRTGEWVRDSGTAGAAHYLEILQAVERGPSSRTLR